MNAVPRYDAADHHASPSPLVIPQQLSTLFEESPRMNASFWRLDERDRRGFVRYIDEATSSPMRERRAAIVAMSLMGLAKDLPHDGFRSDAR